MKIFWNTIRVDLYRAFCSWNFVLSIVFMTLVELLSTGQMLQNCRYSVMEMIDNVFSGTASASILLMLLPLLPYALTYAKDENEGAVPFWIVRSKIQHYMTGKFIASIASAFCSVVISFFCMALILIWKGHPFYNDEISYATGGYMQMLSDNNPVGYMVTYFMDRGLSAAIMAGCAVFLSAVWRNPYVSFVGPVCLYFLLLRLCSEIHVLPPVFHISNWIEGTWEAPEGAALTLMYKFLVAVEMSKTP